MLAVNHSDALPFVGRDLSSLILGQADPASVNDPVYFMTEDDPTRGLHMNKRDGLGYFPITEPAHVETVIARLDDGHLWKFSRYFDNPQYWTDPGTPGDDDPATPGVDVKDVLQVQMQEDPPPPMPGVPYWSDVLYQAHTKVTPEPDEFEMYDLDDDAMELKNLCDDPNYSARRSQLEDLLVEQRQLKRLSPISGEVPGGKVVFGQP
jgi:choline-sulfatase